MPFLSMKMKGATLVRKGLERLRRKWPLVSRQRMYDAAREIRRLMAVEGAPPTYPIKWDSDRQRKAFFATDGFGRGIPTVRSGDTSKAWMVVPVPGSPASEGYDVGNPLAHAKYLYGTARSARTISKVHGGSGSPRWPVFYKVAQAVIAKLPKKVREALITIARHEGFKAR